MSPLLLVLALASADFAYHKSLTPPTTDNPIVAFTLDAEVYSHTRDDLADLRVLNADGQELPYQLQTHSVLNSSQHWVGVVSTVNAIDQLPDNTLQIQLTRKDGSELPAELRFATPLVDFEHQVEVAVGDGKSWRVIAPDALIFDYTRFYDLRQLAVPLPAHSGAHYRIRVSNITDETRSPRRTLTQSGERITETQELVSRPFRIDSVSLWHREARSHTQPKLLQHPLVASSTQISSDSNETHIHLRTNRQPITQFQLQNPSANWSRQVIVEIPTDNDGWRSIATETCSQIDLPGLRRDKLRVVIPETRSLHFRLRILNQDSPALRPTIAAWGVAHQLVLFSRDAPARLLYGAESAMAPQYDIGSILSAQTTVPAYGELSAESANAVFAAPSGWRHRLNDKRLLGLALVVMVVLLGFALYQGAKRQDQQ
jgi:hypothetical protein